MTTFLDYHILFFQLTFHKQWFHLNTEVQFSLLNLLTSVPSTFEKKTGKLQSPINIRFLHASDGKALLNPYLKIRD